MNIFLYLYMYIYTFYILNKICDHMYILCIFVYYIYFIYLIKYVNIYLYTCHPTPICLPVGLCIISLLCNKLPQNLAAWNNQLTLWHGFWGLEFWQQLSDIVLIHIFPWGHNQAVSTCCFSLKAWPHLSSFTWPRREGF